MSHSNSSRNLANSKNEFNEQVWTEQAISALRDIRISNSRLRRHNINLNIPLDGPTNSTQAIIEAQDSYCGEAYEGLKNTLPRSREPMRRDSLKRRDALLQGKPGSRRRQKWENDRLLGNPWAQAPLPSDWDVAPTYPVRAVPYFLAPLWDEEKAKQARLHVKNPAYRNEAGRISKELRLKLKHSKGAKSLLQDLEEEVRRFLIAWEEKNKELESQGLADIDSSEDEEIVFVGRNGDMNDMNSTLNEEKELRRDKMIFDSLIDDHGASFGRWLVHSIAHYYDLMSWSINTESTPVRRQAYIGMNPGPLVYSQLPRPLWVSV